MASDYHHGARVQEVSDTLRAIRTVDTSTIGIIVTADDADTDAFPLNQPTLVTDIYGALGKAGEKGTFARSLDAIKDQTRPLMVVVRVAEATSAAEQTANVIGGVTASGKKTGIQALLAAQSQCGVRARILGVPVYDNADVVNELVTVAQATRAMVYAATHCESIEAAADYRENFGQRELMLIHGDFTAFDTIAKAPGDAYTIARALGLRAKIDAEQSWSRCLSNIVVNGVTGIAQNISWDLQDPNTDAGYLNAREITTLIRRDGFRFWGSRTCAPQNGDFMFETYTRTAQILADTIAEAQFEEIDSKMLPVRVKHIIESINAKLRAMTREGDLLGGEAWYPDNLNSAEILKSGKLWISYQYTPVPPLENLMLRQTITDAYLVDFAAAVAAA